MAIIRCGRRFGDQLGAIALTASILGSGAIPVVRGQDSTRPATPEPQVLCAFDTEEDLKAWRVEDPYKPISFTLTTEAGEFKEGTGAAKIRTERDPDYTTGALILDIGKIDEKKFRGLSIWVFADRPQPGRLELALIPSREGRLPWIDGPFGGSELGSCIYFATAVTWTGWRELKIPVSAFQARSGRGGNVKPKLGDVGSLVLYDATRKGLDIRVDTLRRIEAPEKKK